MKLYHGTTEHALASILQNGIVPRPERHPGNWKDETSQPGFVYLTLSHALWYAAVPCKRRNRPVILEMDIDQIEVDRIHPDEDYLKQEASEWYGGSHVGDPDWSVDVRQQQGLWRASLDKIGNVAVLGAIPVSAIRRYALLSNRRALWQDWYPGKLARNMRYYPDHKALLEETLEFIFDSARSVQGVGKRELREMYLLIDEDYDFLSWDLSKLVREVKELSIS